MWQAYQTYATNSTTVMKGETYFSFTATGGHTTFSSSPPPSATAQQSRSRKHSNQQGTQPNPYVMNVMSPQTTSDIDSFTTDYNHWTLEEHFDEVYILSTTFLTSDPPFGAPSSLRPRGLRPFVLIADSAYIAADVTTV